MVANEPRGEHEPASADVETDAVDTEASQEVMRLLSEHVPLTLLADLASPSGPESPKILEDEGLPDVEWWQDGSEGQDAAEGTPVTP